MIVTFTQAATLQSLGYAGTFEHYYSARTRILWRKAQFMLSNDTDEEDAVPAPSNEDALTFIREKFGIDCAVVPVMNNNMSKSYRYHLYDGTGRVAVRKYPVYEQAAREGMDKLLELVTGKVGSRPPERGTAL